MKLPRRRTLINARSEGVCGKIVLNFLSFIFYYFTELWSALEPTQKLRGCPTCNSEQYKPLFVKDAHNYVRCDQCRTVYINPIPDDAALAQLYDELGDSYFLDSSQLALDHSPEKYIKEIAFLRRVYEKLPGRVMKEERLLEAGCATGSFLVAAKELGFGQVSGLDTSKPAIKYAQQLGLNAIAGDFTTTDQFPSDYYDVIVMWALLEHLPNPRAFVQRAKDLLSPRGIALASVPNSKSLSARLLGRRWRMVNHLHLNYWTAESLTLLFEEEGLTVTYHETQSINPIVIWGDIRGAKVSTDLFISDYKRTHVVKSNPILAPARWVYREVDRLLRATDLGDLLLIAAQK